MKIAVTGIGGYIGGWVRTIFPARGHLLQGQDRVHVPGTSYPVFDLADHGRRREWLEDGHPDAVVHLAALYGRVWGEDNLISTVGANAGITAELARDCQQLSIPLMFLSSSEVYGRSALDLVTPHSPLDPLNMYGMSKKWGEEACLLYAPEGLVIARLNMPYGPPKDQPQPGERPHTSGVPGLVGYNVLHSMTWEATHGLPLTVHEGTERCLTWVGDAVTGLAQILECGEAGIFNVCRNDDHRTVAELAKLVLTITGSASEVMTVPAPPGVTPRKSLDNTALLRLGWKPTTDLDAGIKRCWEFFSRFDKDGRWQG